MNEPNESNDHDSEARAIARRWAREAASRGVPLASMLSELERLAEPFYLGTDEDPDTSDLDVWP